MDKKCIICGCLNKKINYKWDQFTHYKCLLCGIISLFPQPKASSIESHNLSRYESKKSKQAYFNMRDIMFKRAELSVTDILRFKSNGKLLDVGCSYGFYLKVFQKYGFSTLGIDISKSAIKYLGRVFKLNGIVGEFSCHYFQSKSFEVITMFDTFEHFSNPKAVLLKSNKILKKNGLIVIQTPNIDSIISKLTGRNWFWLLPPEHLYLFSFKSLKLLLDKTGFKVLKISTWDDHHEFMSNLLYIIGIKYWGKTAVLHRILVKLKYALIPISYFWNIFFLGGEFLIYAQKE